MSAYAWYDDVIFTVGYFAELGVLWLAIRRKLYRILPVFFAYFAFVAFRDLIWQVLSRTPVYYQGWAFYAYWISDSLLCLMRALTIATIGWYALREYPLVWELSWKVLASVAGIFLVLDAFFTYRMSHSIPQIFPTEFIGLELMQAVLLLLIFTIVSHYGIQLRPLYRLVMIGLCCYSSIQVGNCAMQKTSPFALRLWQQYIEAVAYNGVLLLWGYALWRWAEVPVRQPERLTPAVYDELSPAIQYRLRALNDRLAEMLRS